MQRDAPPWSFFHRSLGSHLRIPWGWGCWPGRDGLVGVMGMSPRGVP